MNDPDKSIILKAHNDAAFHAVTIKFKDIFDTTENGKPTAMLWVQYFRVSTLSFKQNGDWNLHLETVKNCCPTSLRRSFP